MKKLISVLLCLTVIVGLIPTALFNVSAAGDIEQITANQISNVSWNADILIKYVYLKVNETGFYDISVEDLKDNEGYLQVNITDMDEQNNTAWYYTNVYLDNDDSKSDKNVYLIAGHMYEIRAAYGEYDSGSYDFIPYAADINISIMKNGYEIQELILEQNKNLTLGAQATEWIEFTTAAEGDYLFQTSSTCEFGIEVYEKVSGNYVYYASFSSTSVTRLRLNANTQYIIKTYEWANSSKLIRFSVSKADKNVSEIEVVQDDTLILANYGYISNDVVYLYDVDVQSFKYKVTYTDKTSNTLTYSDLRSAGIYLSVDYKGGIYSYDDIRLMEAGKQSVEVKYMNNLVTASHIYVTPYVEWLAEDDAIGYYSDMIIEYEDREFHSYCWKIEVYDTYNYQFYSSDWEEIDFEIIIYDKNNKVVPYNKGWNLVGGETYCVNVNFVYKEGRTGDVEFYFDKNEEHVHTYKNDCDITCDGCNARRVIVHNYKTTVTVKATPTKNGKAVTKCTVCGKVRSTEVVKYVKTVKLSATTYTYNGKVKTPAVTVKNSSGEKLVKGTDYTVTYAKGRKNVGTYKVTVKMIGKYSGTKTLSFKINPSKTSIYKVVGKSKSVVVAINKKSTQVTGYQLQYATNKKFTGAKTKNITSYKSTKTTIKSLKAKTTYYVRVRTYKTVNGVKYYSGWSTAAYAKTK